MTANGISEDDLNDLGSLRERDPAKYRYLAKMPYRVNPRAYEALATKHGVLKMKLEKLRVNHREITPDALARESGVSVRTLRRRCRKYGIKLRDLCPVRRHRKPKIDSGKLHDLAA